MVWEYSVRNYGVKALLDEGLDAEFIKTICYLAGPINKLCFTCKKDIMYNKVPNLSVSISLALYDITDCLEKSWMN